MSFGAFSVKILGEFQSWQENEMHNKLFIRRVRSQNT